MGGYRKRVSRFLVMIVCVILLSGCNKKNDANMAAYLNNTLEYFISNTGIEVVLSEGGKYVDEEKQLTIVVKDNLIQSIQMGKPIKGYTMDGIHIGDKQKRVEKLVKDSYKSQPEVITEDNATSYAYQQANHLFTITYDQENLVKELRMDITAFTVGSVTNEVIGESQISKDEVMVTVGNIDVSYSEAMIYLRTAQQIYETEFDNNLWSYDLNGNGTTIGAVLKQEVLNQIIQLEVINMVANERGITLNDDEMLEVRNYAADYMRDISENDKIKYGITEDLAVQVFATNLIAEKLYETVTIDVDTDVTDDEAKQCKINRLFLKTYGMDSKGNRTELRASELKEIKEKADAIYEEALQGANFYTLAEANSDDDTIEYTIGQGDLTKEEEEVAFSLKDGEVSDVIQTKDGYVILYCVNANDEDAILQVKEAIIEQRRSDLFVKLYSEWYTQYEVKVNMNLWNKLELSPLEVGEK